MSVPLTTSLPPLARRPSGALPSLASRPSSPPSDAANARPRSVGGSFSAREDAHAFAGDCVRPISRGDRSYADTPASDVAGRDAGAERFWDGGRKGGARAAGGGGGGGITGAVRMKQDSVRLQPVPRRAHNMLSRLVDRPLEQDHEWSSAVVGGDGGGGGGGDAAGAGCGNGPAASPARREFVYESTLDPHLQEYWSRRRDVRRIVQARKEAQRRRQAALYGRPQRAPRAASATLSLSDAAGSGRGAGRSATAPLDCDAAQSSSADIGTRASPSSRSPSSTSSASTPSRRRRRRRRRCRLRSEHSRERNCTPHHQEEDKEQEEEEEEEGEEEEMLGHERRRRKDIDASPECFEMPINRDPFNVRELLCLKTLLVPRPNFSCKLAIKNCDLTWLRRLMEGAHSDLDKSAVPDGLNTLATLATSTILASDATHYNNDDERFTATLINSPRSAIVLLRNGAEAYHLLRRPAKFYVRVGEAVHPHALEKRQQRAERERTALLSALLAQYDAVRAEVSLDDVVRTLTAGTAGRSGGDARAKVQEKYERDLRQIERLEERTKKIALTEMRRREENAQRAYAAEELLQEKKLGRLAAVEAKAEEVRQKLAAKRRIIDRIHAIRHEVTLELQEGVEHKREKLHQRVASLKEERRAQAQQKAEENEQRVRRARELLAERREAHQNKLWKSECQKRQRAEEFHLRQAEENAALRHRQDTRREKQVEFKSKAEALQARLVARTENKLDAAAKRFRDFQAKRREELRVIAERQRERERRIEMAIEQASSLHQMRANEISARQSVADKKLEKRRRRAAQRQAEEREAHHFELAHKHRIVAVRQQQDAFQRLLSVAMLQQREADIAAYEEVRTEVAQSMQKGAIEMRLKRDELRETSAEHILRQERDIAARTYAITNPVSTFAPPSHLRDVAPRIGRSTSAAAPAGGAGGSSGVPGRSGVAGTTPTSSSNSRGNGRGGGGGRSSAASSSVKPQRAPAKGLARSLSGEEPTSALVETGGGGDVGGARREEEEERGVKQLDSGDGASGVADDAAAQRKSSSSSPPTPPSQAAGSAAAEKCPEDLSGCDGGTDYREQPVEQPPGDAPRCPSISSTPSEVADSAPAATPVEDSPLESVAAASSEQQRQQERWRRGEQEVGGGGGGVVQGGLEEVLVDATSDSAQLERAPGTLRAPSPAGAEAKVSEGATGAVSSAASSRSSASEGYGDDDFDTDDDDDDDDEIG